MKTVAVVENMYGDYHIYVDKARFTTHAFKYFAIRKARKLAATWGLDTEFTAEPQLTTNGQWIVPIICWKRA